MLREQDQAVLEQNDAARQPDESPVSKESTDSIAILRRIERLLFEIRGRLETSDRARRHQHFSLARVLGALLEVLVIGFVIAAIADWAYGSSLGGQLVSLAFAGVFQLGALTAFMLARDDRPA